MFRILVASDIHLGYNEKHHERGDDSFRSFEEVLQLAQSEDVDLLLLGGDLFHANKPTFRTLQRCVELLRKYCFGDRPIQFNIVNQQSDGGQSDIFSHPEGFKHANYLDPNLNVSLPVFSIHGNHDDPTGANPLSVVETLSTAGLINYFGKYTNYDNILLEPILLQKENVHVALYGLGSINEERLYRTVTHGKLNYLSPTSPDDWFKILVVHQNRTARGNTKYLPEKFLSKLPNLVIWGHEHESIIEPDFNPTEGFFVLQPGSTVATSLCEGESKAKHCFLIDVTQDDASSRPSFKHRAIPLKSVRHMVWESIDLADVMKKRKLNPTSDAIEDLARRKIDEMIQQARIDHTGDKRQPKLPLVRLRLEYTDDWQKFHVAKFGASYTGRVANHSEMIHYIKKKLNATKKDDGTFDIDEMKNLLDMEAVLERVQIEDIIRDYFEKTEDEKAKLGLLMEKGITGAVKEFVDKDSSDAIDDNYLKQKKKVRDFLLEKEVDEDNIQDLLMEFRDKLKDEERKNKD